MKKILLKVLDIALYFLGTLLIMASLGVLMDGGNIFWSLLCIAFSILIFPVSYRKIKELLRDKLKIEGKILIPYIVIVFLGFVISFAIVTNNLAGEQQEERDRIEAMTKLEVSYSIENGPTTAENIVLDLHQENLEKLAVNGKELDVSESNINYTLPLNLGDNQILIIGENGNIKREFTKSIERITFEEQQALIEEEKERLVLEEQKMLEEQARIEAEAREQEEIAQRQLEEQKEREKQEAISTLNVTIGLIDTFDGYDYSTLQGIQLTIALFSSFAIIRDQYKDFNDTEIKALVTSLEKKTSALQVKEFPKMRKAYGNIANVLVWEFNVDVNIIGTSNNTIEFIGGIFADNKNKSTIYSTIKEVATNLRFDNVRFKWYKYDSDYTTFTPNSLADSEVKAIQ